MPSHGFGQPKGNKQGNRPHGNTTEGHQQHHSGTPSVGYRGPTGPHRGPSAPHRGPSGPHRGSGGPAHPQASGGHWQGPSFKQKGQGPYKQRPPKKKRTQLVAPRKRSAPKKMDTFSTDRGGAGW